jgi:hypothetical protein
VRWLRELGSANKLHPLFKVNKSSGGQNSDVHMFGLALGLPLNEIHDADGKE